MFLTFCVRFVLLVGTFCCGLLGTNQSFAQVRTTVLRDANAKLDNFIPYHTDRIVSKVKSMPPVDVEGAIARHKAAGNPTRLYGVPVQTTIGQTDGETEKIGGITIWRTAARSVGAVSLSLHLDNLFLPEGAEMYVYNKAGTMVSGPVTSMHVYEGQYATDLLEGDEIILSVVMPEASEKFSVNVHTVIHGLDDRVVQERGFGTSKACNIDVNCPQGAAWTNQRDATAIILNTGLMCSGTLINTDCQNLRSFLLTANHCLQNQNIANWVFRFRYDSPNPNPANNCRGSEPTTWLTYSGANLRASNAATDFALVELFGSIVGQSTLAFAGWNRSDAIPTNSTMIHHPDADVKKITFDAISPVIDPAPPPFSGFGVDALFRLQLRNNNDFGMLEGGSSGGAQFDQDKRIVGQLAGISLPNTCENPFNAWCGRFSTSWIGGGTSGTGLRDWLGNGTGSQIATNTIRSPFVSGSETICTAGQTFTLNHSIPGRTVVWNATPASLFVTTSGSGTTAVLQAISNSINGPATLTFTILSGNCSVLVSKSVWVGKPAVPTTNPSGYPTIQMGLGDFRSIMLTNTPGAGPSSGNWSSTGSISLASSPSGPSATFEGVNNGTGQFYVTTTNICGTSNNGGGAVNVSGGCNMCLQAHPNPAKGILTISLVSEAVTEQYNIERSDGAEAADGVISLYDQLGNVVHQERLTALQQRIDTGDLQPGIYLCEVIRAGHRYKTKVVITQ